MHWLDFWIGAVAGAIGLFLVILALVSLANYSGGRECARWNNGAVCEMVWVPKGEAK